jgi:hypothetical protein
MFIIECKIQLMIGNLRFYTDNRLQEETIIASDKSPDSPTEPRTTEPRMGLLSEWTQPRMGLNPEWDFCPNGLNPEWDSTPNGTQPRKGLNLEWTQPRLGLNLEWTQPRMDFTPNRT